MGLGKYFYVRFIKEMDSIKDRIKVLADTRGVAFAKLESELGFGNGTIGKWDKYAPSSDKLQKVADYFDVSVDYLLGRTNNKQVSKNKVPEIVGAAAHFDLSKLTPEGIEEYNKYIEFLAFKYKGENID